MVNILATLKENSELIDWAVAGNGMEWKKKIKKNHENINYRNS
jgi:hypothetical protein